MKSLPLSAKAYIFAVSTAGLIILSSGVYLAESRDPVRFTIFLALALLCSTFKVSLPGITGTMSANFLFILVGILDFSFSETLAIGCVATTFQCAWKAKKRPRPIQLVFSVTSMAVAIGAAYKLHHVLLATHWMPHPIIALAVTSSAFFLLNTMMVATVIVLAENKSFWPLWQECYFWAFPYYLLGAAIAALLTTFTRQLGWYSSFLGLPIIYIIYRSYNFYLARLEDAKSHSAQMAQRTRERSLTGRPVRL